MSNCKVLLVSATHGNEINASWFISEWIENKSILNTHDFQVFPLIGNPVALKACKRYIDRDLNRSFQSSLLTKSDLHEYEVSRAKELLNLYGPKGSTPCQIAIDLHSTTAEMGNSLVVYGRRPADLAFVSLIQARLGLPVYLHEGDSSQTGFLVEAWPCGFVIEIGPVPQGLIKSEIVEQLRIVLAICFEEMAKIKLGKVQFPDQLVVHSHVSSVDFPRDENGKPNFLIHELFQGQDWSPIQNGETLFKNLIGETKSLEIEGTFSPVFINEAAYAEKNIAFSLTKKEFINITKEDKESLSILVNS